MERSASVIVEGLGRKGEEVSTSRRGLGVFNLVSGVTILLFAVDDGTEQAVGRGVLFIFN